MGGGLAAASFPILIRFCLASSDGDGGGDDLLTGGDERAGGKKRRNDRKDITPIERDREGRGSQKSEEEEEEEDGSAFSRRKLTRKRESQRFRLEVQVEGTGGRGRTDGRGVLRGRRPSDCCWMPHLVCVSNSRRPAVVVRIRNLRVAADPLPRCDAPLRPRAGGATYSPPVSILD